MGANDIRQWNQAAEEYVGQHYPEAYSKGYSLPEGFILKNKDFNELKRKAHKGKEAEFPLNHLSVAMVFNKLKDALKDIPSLTIADYAFTDTLLKGINSKQKNEFIKNFGVTKEDLISGDHDVFGIGISGSNVIGIFFQVKATTFMKNSKSILDSLSKATRQIKQDFNIFCTMCSEFITSNVKLAGFAAFPMLSKFQLQEVVRCRDCRTRILTSEDLDDPTSFRSFLDTHGIVLEKSWNQDSTCPVMKTFKNIFDLYVCAASTVELPRNPAQLFTKCDDQMKKMLIILTPQQRELVREESKIIFIWGGPGTGKTVVLKERALQLAEKGEVLLMNLPGGLLTEEFRLYFQGNVAIQIFDGREEGLDNDFGRWKSFLQKRGEGKHILIDEVPITFGLHGIITPESLSRHWCEEEYEIYIVTVCVSRPIFIVVDDEERKNTFVHILASFYPTIPFLFHMKSELHGRSTAEGSSPVIIVTEEEMMGCYITDVIMVMDFPLSQWRNYIRLIATTGENKIIVIEEEELTTGRFSPIKEIPGWNIEKANIVEASLMEMLEKAWEENNEKSIPDPNKQDFPLANFPEIYIDCGRRGEEQKDVEKMLGSCLSGIFGCPASGKSRRVDLLIDRVIQRRGHVLLLHSGSKLSQEAYRQRWSDKGTVGIDAYDFNSYSRQERSLQNIFVYMKVKEAHTKWMEKKNEKDGVGPFVIIAEDFELVKDFEETINILKRMEVHLIIAFKSHSGEQRRISLRRAVEALKVNPDCTVIALSTQPTNVCLLRYIQRNETRIALKLEARNLYISSIPAAIVLGPPVQFINSCSRRHYGYICNGKNACGNSLTILPSLCLCVLQELVDEDQPYVLVSDENLLLSLQEKINEFLPNVHVKHSKDFRGCETSVVISVNVNDEWLLEVISRSRSRLIIIDNIPNHEDLWRIMTEKQSVVILDILYPKDDEAGPRTLLSLDDAEHFLRPVKQRFVKVVMHFRPLTVTPEVLSSSHVQLILLFNNLRGSLRLLWGKYFIRILEFSRGLSGPAMAAQHDPESSVFDCVPDRVRATIRIRPIELHLGICELYYDRLYEYEPAFVLKHKDDEADVTLVETFDNRQETIEIPSSGR
ncbi:unnamed protein product [Darwinula stevensoni]|uniref:Uncharacterized protein n=1 Tax=Darwinula stevensoni TaxID=69355 RepID=A0A7R9A4X7_9CRUS|nr:unnamed protein product [Darwinula stevensoni]CAG0885219.1 unnamed protein product [Darwinula stevensoni]